MFAVLSRWRWMAAIFGTLAIILLVNPVGFVGGGWDDWHYLDAARCWKNHGWCVPTNHWQGRWPIIAPLAAVIRLFGESRLAIGLPSLAYSIGCLALLTWLGNRLAVRPVGYLAALFLLVVPAFAVELLDPTVEAAELFFLLAGACCVALYADTRSRWLAFAAGLFLSLAFQVRETAIAAAPLSLVGAWLLARDDRKSWLAAVAGALLPLIGEALVFWIATGDPLWRRHLSIAHTQVSSSELLGPIDRTHTPFLNPAYIANWRHEPGIHLHWLVDGLINLVANAKAGLTLFASAALFAIYGRRLEQSDRQRVGWCLCIALYWACFLIYVLAIDPKARMMFVPIALTSLALAIILNSCAAKGSALMAFAVAAVVWVEGVGVTLAQPQVWTSEAAAERWAKRFPGQIETSQTTRRHLELSSAASQFADLTSNRPYLVLRLSTRCSVWADEVMKGALLSLDRSPMGLVDPPHERAVNNLCLFRYLRPISPEEITRSQSVR